MSRISTVVITNWPPTSIRGIGSRKPSPNSFAPSELCTAAPTMPTTRQRNSATAQQRRFGPRPPRAGAAGEDGVRRGCSDSVSRVAAQDRHRRRHVLHAYAPSTVDGHRAGRCSYAEHSYTSAAGASCVSDPTAAMGLTVTIPDKGNRPCGSRGPFPVRPDTRHREPHAFAQPGRPRCVLSPAEHEVEDQHLILD